MKTRHLHLATSVTLAVSLITTSLNAQDFVPLSGCDRPTVQLDDA